MGEHDGHRARMYKKYWEHGFDIFENHELLEMLLFFAKPRVNTNELAHRLINQFGSISGVLDAPKEELLKVEGMGQASVTLIKLVPQFARIYKAENEKVSIINTTSDAAAFLRPRFSGNERERVIAVCLDAKNKVLAASTVYEGSFNMVGISLGRIVSAAVNCGAASIVLAHNHPSGNALPSEADIETTAMIAQTLENLNITLFDHLIFADDDFVSMAETEKESRYGV